MSARERLRDNDIRLVSALADLRPDEWAQPSLCDAWTNHEVLAHLVIGYRTGIGTFAATLVRHQGSFDRANTALAKTLAQQAGPADLLDELSRLIDRPRGLGRIFPPQLLLGDHVTHELDILFPLGRPPGTRRDVLAAVLNTQVTVPNPFVPAFANSRRIRLRATDIAWTHGDAGPVVQGCAADLVSVLGNRPHALPRLTGDGVDVLAARVSPRPSRTAG
ncbi:TIGR03083 family protein [Mycolicibacterium rutilum]|uniref:TIGR03083 family protein n=1 Tax=Mycolicibacterium rutilum TaxID=370526 RepID=A0A1H6K5U0_MYCRU|nr:maleylpyruvate isomerase family mycothiol-dependent enzyme [Mycolicibacterium rutilum]SEH70325.1 TIGR03083 family protein [Mycolicibacterium rutilum]